MWRWIIYGGGVIAVVTVVVWGQFESDERSTKPQFGLSDLVANPYGDEDQLLTPLEEARRSFREQFETKPKNRERPDYSGAKLMLRAVLEFDERERETAINDAVRHLRRFPEVKSDVYKMVDTFRSNNPHLGERVDIVTASVDQRLSVPPKRLLEWLDF